MNYEDWAALFNRFYSLIFNALNGAKDPTKLKTVCRKASTEMDKTFSEQLENSGSKIACRMGCFYCCHIKVDVLPADAFLIADYIRANFSKKKQDALLQTARENWKKIERMTFHEQFISNMPCPLLDGGKCSVYPVRPMLCRLHHSTEVEPCKVAYENPHLLTGPDSFVQTVRHATVHAYMGVKNAFDAKGYDTKAYDINAALVECFSNPNTERRWRDGKSAFPKNMVAKEPPQNQDPQLSLTPD